MKRDTETMIRSAFEGLEDQQVKASLEIVDSVADAIDRLSSYLSLPIDGTHGCFRVAHAGGNVRGEGLANSCKISVT